MNVPLFLAAGGLAETARETAHTFGLNWPGFIAQCLSFGIVAALLYQFAYKPILAVLEDRRQRIAKGLADAQRMKEELDRAQEQARQILGQAGTQANQMIEEARAAAARLQEQETQKALAAARDLVDKARQATEAEHARMLAELRREIGRLVVQTTAKVAGKVLTPEDQQRLIEETNRELAA